VTKWLIVEVLFSKGRVASGGLGLARAGGEGDEVGIASTMLVLVTLFRTSETSLLASAWRFGKVVGRWRFD
jgi:hypothetical protein